MTTLAHFSDLHLCEQLGGKAQQKRILKMVEAAADLGADHFVFTGDFVDHANLEDLAVFYRALTKTVPVEKIHVVPGNHDVFPVSYHKAVSTHGAQNRFEEFNRLSKKFSPKADWVYSDHPYPYVRELNDDVLLIGVDSTHTGWTGRFQGGIGEFDEHVEESLIGALNQPDRLRHRHRVLAIHHYPWHWDFGLFDVEFKPESLRRLRHFLQSAQIDVMLCGHGHWMEERWHKNTMVVCSGSNFQENPEHSLLGFHLIKLGGKTVKAIRYDGV